MTVILVNLALIINITKFQNSHCTNHIIWTRQSVKCPEPVSIPDGCWCQGGGTDCAMNGGSGGGGNIAADDWLTAHKISNMS